MLLPLLLLNVAAGLRWKFVTVSHSQCLCVWLKLQSFFAGQKGHATVHSSVQRRSDVSRLQAAFGVKFSHSLPINGGLAGLVAEVLAVAPALAAGVVLEATTSQIDNLMVPLVVFPLMATASLPQ
jgi:hypothetical protein